MGVQMSDRERISSGSPFESSVGFSRALRVGNRVVVAGTAPIWPDGSCPDDAYLQTKRCLEIILTALAAGGFKAEDIIRTRMFLVDRADSEEAGRAHGEVFSEIRPASTMVVIKALLDPRWKVEIEAEAER
ncbi:RidA family protein [soil metagenome]